MRRQLPLIALTAAAAALRFATLDVQSFSAFELYTVVLERMDLGTMLSNVPEFEGTPPLYYALGWFWAKLFGTGEVGLRSLSALLSTATVPLAYAFAATLADRRAGLCTAAVIAFNPLATWYAQEARAYALLMFLTALGLVFFARLVRGRGRLRWNLVGWSVASALALLTHYFAVLVIAPQFVWLLYVLPQRRYVAAAAVAPLVTALSVVQLALDQRDHAGGGEPEATGLATRVAQVPKQFLVGFDVPAEVPLAATGAVLVLVALYLVLRSSHDSQRAAVLSAAIAASGALLLLALAAVGFDYVLTRYLTVILVPCAAVVGIGLAEGRVGLGGVVALSALALGVYVAVLSDPGAQRPDLRGGLEPIEPGSKPRGVAVSMLGTHGDIYLSRAGLMPGLGRNVDEVVAVGLRVVLGESHDEPLPPIEPPSGFELVKREETDGWVRLWYRAPEPVAVSPLTIKPSGSDPVGLYYQPAADE